jgi:hypothetical protein
MRDRKWAAWSRGRTTSHGETASQQSGQTVSYPGPEIHAEEDQDAGRTVPQEEAAWTDPDRLEELGDRITVLTAQIAAATHQLLVMIAEFDRLRGWEAGGHRSCAHWLAFRTQIDLGTAREKVRAARALEELPQTSAAMARGELTFSQVRALTRVADSTTEADLLQLARGATTAQLERMIRTYRRGTAQDEAEREREQFASRALSIFPDDDGMYVVRGRLMPEEAALLMRAVDAAGNALYREHRGIFEDTAKEAAQRRADALALIAERALAVGFGDERSNDAAAGAGGGVDAAAGEAADQSSPTAATATVGAPAPLSGTRAERYQVMLHVDAAALSAEPPAESTMDVSPERPQSGRGDVSCERPQSGRRDASCERPQSGRRDASCERPQSGRRDASCEAPPAGRGNVSGERRHLEDGTRISHETSRRLCCDASIVRVMRDRSGSVLDVGRRTRTISPALRRALEVRDRGCRFPGCGLRFTDAHHVRHWADGGETSLANCLLLCTHHHRLVHEGGWRIEWWGADIPVFIDLRGNAHASGRLPVAPLGPDPAALLLDNQRAHGVKPGPLSLGTRWRSETEIPDPVRCRAEEALL